LGVLAIPIAGDTGWPVDWVMGGISVGLVVAGLIVPHVGRTIGDRGGGLVLALGAVLLAAGLVALAFAQNFLAYLGAWLIIGAGMSASLYDAAFATLGSIYGKESRGAITAMTLFGGFASTVCWPLSAYLVEHLGWRETCLVYAAIQIGFAMPLQLLVVPRHSFVTADRTGTQAPPPRALSPHEMPILCVLAAVLTIGAAILSMVGTQLLPVLQARGTGLGVAVSLGTIIGPSQVGARVIEMLGSRHYHPIWTMIASTVLVAIGTLWLVVDAPGIAIAIVFYGAGNGIGSIARGTLPLALFEADRYAALMGRLALPILFAMALAPYFGALALKEGGPNLALALVFAFAATNVIFVLVLRRLCADRAR
jgi:predicted MFS family arabinose efflux permease